MPSKTHEFRVREVKRYIVTEYLHDDVGRGSSPHGLFDSAVTANTVAEALAEHFNAKFIPTEVEIS